ncbi:MAG: hypothetical protein SF172_13510 [Burkholderiales bacterium]|nr:hypothetical protein [Burkholderiales bacterium]
MRALPATKSSAALYAIGLILLLTACSGGKTQPLEIGVHRGTVTVPSGWHTVNQGEKWEVRKGEASIVLHALGPASPAAMQREAARIMALWRGNADGAQARVKRLYQNVNRFVDMKHRTQVSSAMLPLLEPAARSLPEAELNQRFADWHEALAAIPTPGIEALGDAALPLADHDRRRAIQSRTQTTFGGKPAMDYLTVTKSTQDFQKRIVVIDNDGHLLAIYLGILGHAAHLKEFDRLVGSIHFDATPSERR